MSIMSTINISLPESLKAFADEQVLQRGCGASSEYARGTLTRGLARTALVEVVGLTALASLRVRVMLFWSA